jgi:hypothetical protein
MYIKYYLYFSGAERLQRALWRGSACGSEGSGGGFLRQL